MASRTSPRRLAIVAVALILTNPMGMTGRDSVAGAQAALAQPAPSPTSAVAVEIAGREPPRVSLIGQSSPSGADGVFQLLVAISGLDAVRDPTTIEAATTLYQRVTTRTQLERAIGGRKVQLFGDVGAGL